MENAGTEINTQEMSGAATDQDVVVEPANTSGMSTDLMISIGNEQSEIDFQEKSAPVTDIDQDLVVVEPPSTSGMSTAELNEAGECVRGKKRKVNKDSGKQIKKYKDNVSGKNKKIMKIPTCRCDCRNKLTRTQRETLFLNYYYALKTHTEQTIFLQGCVDEKHVERHRPRSKDEKPPRDRKAN